MHDRMCSGQKNPNDQIKMNGKSLFDFLMEKRGIFGKNLIIFIGFCVIINKI